MAGVACLGRESHQLCEHMQALQTNVIQRHWEWQEDVGISGSVGARAVQVYDCVCGKLGREDSARRGQAFDFGEMGKGCKGRRRSSRKGLGSWWRDGQTKNATGWSVMFSAPL